MRAMLCEAWGEPETLALRELPAPAIGPGLVRIVVHATALNFADSLIVQGKYQVKPTLPFSPGFEIAGEVTEVGEGVSRLKPGDRVLGVMDYGGYADEVVLRETDVFAIPDAMDFVTAASFPVTYGTSHVALVDRGNLRPGEVLAVHGAAGGVGLAAVEIGKALGATVIATAGGADKVAIAAAHGADHVIDYKAEPIRERVLELTGGRGADVHYDPVGGDVFDASLRSIAWGGRILIVGFAGGKIPQIPANILLVKSVSAVGVFWSSHRRQAPATLVPVYADLFRWWSEGKLKPLVSRTFALEDAAPALRLLLSRSVPGKIVLTTGR